MDAGTSTHTHTCTQRHMHTCTGSQVARHTQTDRHAGYPLLTEREENPQPVQHVHTSNEFRHSQTSEYYTFQGEEMKENDRWGRKRKGRERESQDLRELNLEVTWDVKNYEYVCVCVSACIVCLLVTTVNVNNNYNQKAPGHLYPLSLSLSSENSEQNYCCVNIPVFTSLGFTSLSKWGAMISPSG